VKNTRFDPFEEIARMHEEMDRVFARMFKTHKSKELAQWSSFRSPVADVRETEKCIVASIELPGADKEDIELNVSEDSIEVKTEKKIEKKHEKEGFSSYEGRMSRYYRRIPLPVEIEASQAKASFKNGILRIEAPKIKQLEHKKKRIQIE